MQITRLRYTLPRRQRGVPSVMPAARVLVLVVLRPPSSGNVVSVTAQHLEISERVNYGPTGTNAGQGERGRGRVAIARTRRLAGHGVIVGILVDASRSFTAVTCSREILPRNAALLFPFALWKTRFCGCSLRPVSESFACLSCLVVTRAVILDSVLTAVLYVGVCDADKINQ